MGQGGHARYEGFRLPCRQRAGFREAKPAGTDPNPQRRLGGRGTDRQHMGLLGRESGRDLPRPAIRDYAALHCGEHERQTSPESITGRAGSDQRGSAQHPAGNREMAGHQWRGGVRDAQLGSGRGRLHASTGAWRSRRRRCGSPRNDSPTSPETRSPGTVEYRFTGKGNNLYAIAQSWPGDTAIITSLAAGKMPEGRSRA